MSVCIDIYPFKVTDLIQQRISKYKCLWFAFLYFEFNLM